MCIILQFLSIIKLSKIGNLQKLCQTTNPHKIKNQQPFPKTLKNKMFGIFGTSFNILEWNAA